MKKLLFALALSLPFATTSRADENYGAVTHAPTKKECGACHMAFQPGFLPARSWTALMADLGNHFGEDAKLPDATARDIESYLVANAAKTSLWGDGMLRGVRDQDTPLRITELPKWVREHQKEVPASAWQRKEVGSKANCIACHRAADRGVYEDD
ncbi:diheme cytochrome c [Magnetospira thiophila]